jgi:hypothetical protein
MDCRVELRADGWVQVEDNLVGNTMLTVCSMQEVQFT